MININKKISKNSKKNKIDKLNKIVYNNSNIEYANNILMDFINNSGLVKYNDKLWNYRDNIILLERDNKLYYWSKLNNRLNELKTEYFVVQIEGYAIYKTINIFSQNNGEIANSIYNIVISLMDDIISDLLNSNMMVNLYGIGGEFYVYFRLLRFKYMSFVNNNNLFVYNGYTNNEKILDAAKKNGSCSTNCYNLIDYNTYKFNMTHNGVTLINLSKINKNIINNLKTKYVVAITCKDKGLRDNLDYLILEKSINLKYVKIHMYKIR